MPGHKSYSLADYKKMVINLPKKSKFKNVKVTVDGILFDSKAEAAYYNYLLILKENGDVSYFLQQVPFLLEAGVKYRLDFLVVYSDGRIDHVDVKGAVTPTFKLKKKMVEARYPIKIRCVKQQGIRFTEIHI